MLIAHFPFFHRSKLPTILKLIQKLIFLLVDTLSKISGLFLAPLIIMCLNRVFGQLSSTSRAMQMHSLKMLSASTVSHKTCTRTNTVHSLVLVTDEMLTEPH